MRTYSKDDQEIIDELKGNRDRIHFSEIDEEFIGLLLIERGERLFVQLNDKALLCYSNARNSKISGDSIVFWDSGDIIEEKEKKDILTKIKRYYKEYYLNDLKVV